MKNKEHLTLDGLKKILSYKASLNLGLSEELKDKISDIEAVKRPLIIDKDIPSPWWFYYWWWKFLFNYSGTKIK